MKPTRSKKSLIESPRWRRKFRHRPIGTHQRPQAKLQTRCSLRKQYDRKDWRHCDSLVELRDERNTHKTSSSSSSQADSGLKIPAFKSSGLSSSSRSRSSGSDRYKSHLSRHEEKLDLVHPANHRFKKAFEDNTYFLAETSTIYDWSVPRYIAKIAKCMTVQMKQCNFNPFDPISFTECLKNFKLAYDTNGVHKVSAMCLFHFFMNKTASSVSKQAPGLRAQIQNTAGRLVVRWHTLPPTPQIFKFLLKVYATDKVIMPSVLLDFNIPHLVYQMLQ